MARRAFGKILKRKRKSVTNYQATYLAPGRSKASARGSESHARSQSRGTPKAG